MSSATTVEPIEMPFWIWTQVGPVNHVLDGDPDPCEAILGERRCPGMSDDTLR